MAYSTVDKIVDDLQNKWADSFRCATTCPSDQHPAYEHWEHTKGRESAISQVPHVGAAICSREMWELQTRNHFTYLSPFGRLRIVGLITTMRIPRNNRFVFLDKISIFRSQCGGYVRAVRGTNGCPRHFQQTDVLVRRETFVSGFQSSLQILCIFTLRRIYLARKVYRALTLRFVTLARHRPLWQAPLPPSILTLTAPPAWSPYYSAWSPY